jgi:gamma-glutamyl-gamma-aminobutyrate hydrolase PuuD
MKVHIVGSNGACLYAAMYLNDGWELTDSVDDADLVQFTGGEDVSPDLYGCGKHPTTMNSPARDEKEREVFDQCINLGKKMVGVCRGGQFLNVMCGGRMYQHVNGHAIAGTHKTLDTSTGHSYETTSTHHQMMIPDKGNGFIIGSVSPSLCDFKDYVDADGKIFTVEPDENDEDVEVVHYPYHNVLCFQPHPEYDTGEPCREWFFSLIMHKLFNDNTRYSNLIYGGKAKEELVAHLYDVHPLGEWEDEPEVEEEDFE